MDQTKMAFLFIANRLCLDYINTEIIADGQRKSLLNDFDDVRSWLIQAHAVRQTEIDSITATWDNVEKESFTNQALAFRDSLRTMAEHLTQGQPVADTAIAAINHSLKQRKGYPILHRTAEGFASTFEYEQTAAGLLTPIAESALDLLVHGDLTLLRKCENPECILYFYDTSKNHARRWCSMGVCGNRYKVAAHYRRSRQEQPN